MSEIICVNGIECYEQDGIAYLKLETVARGLGFTQKAKSGNEVVRWERVHKYLEELGVPTSGDDGFIPENVFYRLAMKAKNKMAEAFQAKVADEVIPSIRKHGAYMTPEKIEEVLLNPDTIIRLAQELKAEQEARRKLEAEAEVNRPKALFADSVSSSSDTILVREMAKILRQNGVKVGQNRLYQWLRENGYLIRQRGDDYNMPTQYSLEHGLMTVKESTFTPADGEPKIWRTAKITGKGQLYFVNKFLAQ